MIGFPTKTCLSQLVWLPVETVLSQWVWLPFHTGLPAVKASWAARCGNSGYPSREVWLLIYKSHTQRSFLFIYQLLF
jgi:hypothetical protein